MINPIQRAVDAIIRPPRKTYDLSTIPQRLKGDDDIPYIRVPLEYTNSRNLKLVCSFYYGVDMDPAGGGPCVVYLHGNASSQLEGQFLVPNLCRYGIYVFCFDFAGCGCSDGKYVSLGYYEKDNTEFLLDQIHKQFHLGPFVLWGRSMGAATALLVNYPHVVGRISDSSFTSIPDMCSAIAISMNLPSFFVPAVIWFLKKQVIRHAKFNIESVSPISIKRQNEVPAVFGHAKDDEFIPFEQCRKLCSHYPCKKKEIVVLEGGHNSKRKINWIKFGVLFIFETFCLDIKDPVISTCRKLQETVFHFSSFNGMVNNKEKEAETTNREVAVDENLSSSDDNVKKKKKKHEFDFDDAEKHNKKHHRFSKFRKWRKKHHHKHKHAKDKRNDEQDIPKEESAYMVDDDEEESEFEEEEEEEEEMFEYIQDVNDKRREKTESKHHEHKEKHNHEHAHHEHRGEHQHKTHHEHDHGHKEKHAHKEHNHDLKIINDFEEVNDKILDNIDEKLNIVSKNDEKINEKVKEKTEVKLEEKTEENMDEKSEVKEEEKSEENTDEKPEENTEEKPEENTEEKLEENANEKEDAKSEVKTEEKTEENSEEKTGENTKEKTGEKKEEKSEIKTGEKSEENTDEKSEENTNEKIEEKTDEKPEVASGKCQKEFEENIKKIRIQKVAFKFYPFQYDVYPAALFACDVGIYFPESSFTFEISPRVLELTVSGIPIIAFHFGCVNEIVKDDVNGIIIDKYDELGPKLKEIFVNESINLKSLRNESAMLNMIQKTNEMCEKAFDEILTKKIV